MVSIKATAQLYRYRLQKPKGSMMAGDTNDDQKNVHSVIAMITRAGACVVRPESSLRFAGVIRHLLFLMLLLLSRENLV